MARGWRRANPWRTWSIPLMVGAGISYSIATNNPLKLESFDPELLRQDDISKPYNPPFAPYNIDQANDVLRWEEGTQVCGTGSGVLRFDRVRVPANGPCEDELISAAGHENGEIKWLLWGVFDGHAGWETAAAIHDCVVRYVVRELVAYAPNERISDVAGDKVDRAIKDAFLKMDRDIMDLGAKAASGATFLTNAMSQLVPCYAGSCALLSYYNSGTQDFKVACVGDSRAVLGRRNASGGWDAFPLSVDQTGYNKDEVSRLEKEHPDEPNMIKAGRLLGLAVTRAFGDSRWKWDCEVQEKAHSRFFGPKIRDYTLTPPYLTAEPVITTTKIEPDKGDFVIQASDGLWDNLTSQQAVDLVGKWLDKNDPSKDIPAPDLAASPATPSANESISVRQNPDASKSYSETSPVDAKHFVVVDDNAATHLVRNSLGGGDEDRLCGMLTPTPPFARNVRCVVHLEIFCLDFRASVPDCWGELLEMTSPSR
ncbi:[Pyruvate dehydrogenase [acetyl-transferring]]-phosphatase 1, mitochondrial [Lecanora helva]